MSDELGWHYERQPPNGGAPGDAYTQSLNGTGFDLAQLVAREAIQNSVDALDASAGNNVVAVTFRIRELDGPERILFEKAACIEDMRTRFDALELDPACCLAESDGALRLLYVEDYNTIGLAGNPQSNSSNFRKLLMNIGLSDKTSDDQGGGSYGLGKSVYSGNSRIQTIFAFSRTHDHLGKPITILMGCAYQRHHDFGGDAFTGRAWLGRCVSLPGEGYRMDPLMGGEAEELARELGFEREADEFGTSVLILDTDLEAMEIVRGVEDYWWPRIVEQELEVDVIDSTGAELTPQPIQRPHLRPFIDAWNVVIQRSPPTSGQERHQFQRQDDKQLGAVGLTALEVDDEGSTVLDDDEGELEVRIDSVALIRSPKMVVDYHRGWNPGRPPIVGAFFANKDIDRTLKLSEPPAHNKWDRGAPRLKGVPNGSEIVKSLHRRIRSRLKAFQRNLRPPETDRPRRLLQLERELAKWLGVGKKSKQKPEHPETPISLRWPTGVQVEAVPDGSIRAVGEVVAALSRDEDIGSLPISISFACLVVEEGSVKRDSSLPLEVEAEYDGRLERAEGTNFTLTLEKSKQARFFVKTAPYDPRWTVKLIPEVTPVVEAAS